MHAMGVTFREKVELDSYQLEDVAQVWYTQWKGNRPEELDPIEWEEFKEVFHGKYFSREMREYSLKFSKMSKYAPSLVSNPRDEMSCFVMGVADLVRE